MNARDIIVIGSSSGDPETLKELALISPSRWPTEASDLANRIRFISVLGVLSSAMSFLVILAQGIATVNFDPCQL
jgi:hypothetical protein